MNRTATILATIFGYEFLLWFTFFNAIFYADLGMFGWFSWPALALGLVFARVIVHFDESFVTADTTDSFELTLWSRTFHCPKWPLPGIIRFGFIAISVVAAAAVLDLVLFKEPIDRRIEEENLRWYLVTFSDKLDPARTTKGDVTSGEEERFLEAEILRVETESREVQGQRNQDQARLNGHRASMSAIEEDRAELRRRLRELRSLADRPAPFEPGSGSSDNKGRLRAQIKELEDENDELRDAYLEHQQKSDGLPGQIEGYNKQLETLAQEKQTLKDRQWALAQSIGRQIIAKEEEAALLKQKISSWVEQYRLVANKTPLTDNLPVPQVIPGDGKPPRPDVFQRYRILEDLKRGWPPIWPPTSQIKIDKLTQDFSLEDPPLCSSGPEGAQAPPGHCRSAVTYTMAYKILFLVSMVVPLMAIVCKLLMSSADTKTYYSLHRQARAGNLHALEQLSAKHDLDGSVVVEKGVL